MKTSKMVKLPKLGRFGLVHEKAGNGAAIGLMSFDTNLSVRVIRNGEAVHAKDVMSRWARFWGNINGQDTLIDLGSGLVTNVGVLALANDFQLASPSGAAINTIKLANYHATGTGVTAAAATDIKLQTVSSNGGQTPVAGTQTLVSAANDQKYRTVATVAYTGTEAVTEWGLFLGGTLSASTGSPFTAGSATTGTVTATPLTASSSTVQGQQQTIFERTSGTNLSYGLVTSNTTSVVTVPAWYLVASGLAGQAPANTETYVIRPVMWDHKVFSAINVINGDSIQFTYTLTINSGG
jgi:hypothetical protein